jgi:hypothetical protein
MGWAVAAWSISSSDSVFSIQYKDSFASRMIPVCRQKGATEKTARFRQHHGSNFLSWPPVVTDTARSGDVSDT